MKYLVFGIALLFVVSTVYAFDISTVEWGSVTGGGSSVNGSVGYWDRTGTVLSPITAGDDISTTGTGTFGGLVDTSLLDTYIPYSNSNTLTGDIGLNYEKKDGYVVLDGTNDYVTITDSVALSPTDDLTVFIWAKGAGQAKQIFSHYDYGAGQRAWSVAGGGASGVYFKIIISDDGSYDAANIKEWTGTDTVLLDNTWNSVAFTFASGTLKMFVDGIEQTTITKTTDAAITTIHDSTKSLTLGTYLNNDPTPGNAYFAGGLDNAMVIDRVLSPAEITALHALGRDAEYTDANLQGNWRFDDGTADDNTANAGDGTLVNGAYITDLSILQVPKIEVNELDVLGGNLTFKRYDEANFLIESLNHDTAAVILKRTGDAYYDWQVLNTGGDLSFQYSTDDTASWINSLTIGFNAQLLYEGLLEVTRDTFPVISSIRQETSYVADPAFYFVNSIYTQDTTSAYSENYRGGFVLFNTNSAGEKTAAAFFGSALYDYTDGAELGSLKFFPFQAGTTSNGNIGGNLDLRALTSTTGEAVFNSMDVSLAGDNQKLLFGAAQDSSIYYDGVTSIFKPDNVGTGAFTVLKGSFDALDLSGNADNMAVAGGQLRNGDQATGGWFGGQSSSGINTGKSTYGINSFAYMTGSAGNSRSTLPGVVGGLYGVRMSSSGTVGWGANIVSRGVQSAGTITKLDGVAVLNPAKSGGTLTDFYGLHIYNLTAGTNNFAFYSESNPSYFGGSITGSGDNNTFEKDVIVNGTIWGGSPIHFGDNLNMTEHNITDIDNAFDRQFLFYNGTRIEGAKNVYYSRVGNYLHYANISVNIENGGFIADKVTIDGIVMINTNQTDIWWGDTVGADGTLHHNNQFFTNGTLTWRSYAIDNVFELFGDFLTAEDIIIDSDTSKLYFGEAQDSSISYNGTDLVVNPKEVGGGAVIVDGDLDNTGNYTGNMVYGEMWNYSAGGFGWNFEINDANIYYNVSNLTFGQTNGFHFMDNLTEFGGSYLVAEVSGMYKLDMHMSFSGETAGGLYSFAIVHDWDVDAHRNCYSRREARTDVGAVSITCLMDLNAGQQINVQIENENNARDIQIHTVNLNVVRIGDM